MIRRRSIRSPERKPGAAAVSRCGSPRLFLHSKAVACAKTLYMDNYLPDTLISPTSTDGLPMPEPGKVRSLPTARMDLSRS